MHNDMWTTTTQLHCKNNNTDNKKINVDRLPVKFSRAQLRRQITVRDVLLRCTPSRGIWWPRVVLHKVNFTFWRMQLREQWTDVTPHYRHLVAKEQYYIRSSWLWVILQVRLTFIQTYPSRGIWWPRAVLHKVNLTFWRMQLRGQQTVRCTPIEASGGQDCH